MLEPSFLTVGFLFEVLHDQLADECLQLSNLYLCLFWNLESDNRKSLLLPEYSKLRGLEEFEGTQFEGEEEDLIPGKTCTKQRSEETVKLQN